MNITAALHMHARLRPHALAVITPKGSLTFAQLDALIWRTAIRFRAEGLQAGHVVMLNIADPLRHLIVALALARIGVAHLANLPGQDAAVMAPLMERVGASRTISSDDVRGDALLAGSHQLDEDSARRIASEMARHDSTPWLYVPSSGTTGRPKIIPITQRMTLQRWRRFAAGVPTLTSDRFMALSSLSFHFPKVQTLGALDIGGCAVLADGLADQKLLDFMRSARVTRLSCAPLHLHALCALGEQRDNLLLPELRVLEVTTSTVPDDLRRRVRQHVCGNLYVIYGAIEAASLTVAPPEMQSPGTVGAALPGIELQIVDNAGRPLPRGEVGLIRVRAAGTVDRYHDDAEATARAFRDGWYYPGDMGALTDDEQLIFKGRADDMMVFDGINVYPMEIESALAAHEAVREVAAFPVRSDVHQDVPVAAVTLCSPVGENELLAYCRAHLGTRSPRHVLVIEEFPRNPNGKILKRELPALVQSRLALRPAP